MADDRTSTIIKEIKYWKEHKLLPETQCDFLLALYTQGGSNILPSKANRKQQVNQYIHLVLLILVVPFSLLVVYFTQFNFILQLSIIILFMGYAFWVFSYFRKNDSNYAHIAMIAFLVILLILTDFISNTLLINQYLKLILFILNFIGWFLLSRRLQYKYLMITSILAFILLLFVNFSHLFSFN